MIDLTASVCPVILSLPHILFGPQCGLYSNLPRPAGKYTLATQIFDLTETADELVPELLLFFLMSISRFDRITVDVGKGSAGFTVTLLLHECF